MGILDRFRRRTPELRDPRAATTVSRTGVGLASLRNLNDEQITRRMWLANVYVDACIRAIATDLARLKFRAGPDPDQPEGFNPTAPLALLLGPAPGGPNPYTSPRRLWQWTVAQRVAFGRWAWEVELDAARRPVALWPLPVHRLTPITPDANTGQWFSGFEFTGADGKRVRLAPDEVIYDWVPHPDDFRHWVSPLQAARLDVEVLVSQDRYDAAFIRNENKPSTIVVHREFPTEDERDAWRAEFSANHAGPDNAGKTHFTEVPFGFDGSPKDALEVITVGVSQREAQALERYAAKLQNVCVALGVPLGRLGNVSGRTYANAEREIKTYWQNTILPLATEFADAVNMQLAPRLNGGSDVGWWDTSEVEELRPAPLLALPSLVEAERAGFITRDEGRELLGLSGPAPEPDPEPAGEEDPERQPVRTFIEPTSTPTHDLPLPDRVRSTQPAPPLPKPAPERIDRPTVGVDERDAERRARFITATEAHTAALERSWQRRMQEHFDAQRDAILSRLEGNRGVRAHRRGELRADAVFDRDYWARRLTVDTEALYAEAVSMAGGNLAAHLGLSFDLHAPHIEAFISTRANQLAGQVTDTTYRAIQQALIAGVQAGEGIPQLADRIRTLFDQTYANRAETVARTEVISAYNGGATVTALVYGPDVVAGMEWIATADERTRPAHAAAHGQVVALGQPFLVDGEQLAYPGDPNGSPGNVVQCRCATAPLTPSDYGRLTGRARAPQRVAFRTVEELAVRAALGEVAWDEALAELTGGAA